MDLDLVEIRRVATAFYERGKQEMPDGTGPVQYIAGVVLALVDAVERLTRTYVPQDVASECLKMLEEAGLGGYGRPNTLYGMVRDARNLLIEQEGKLREERGTADDRCPLCRENPVQPDGICRACAHLVVSLGWSYKGPNPVTPSPEDTLSQTHPLVILRRMVDAVPHSIGCLRSSGLPCSCGVATQVADLYNRFSNLWVEQARAQQRVVVKGLDNDDDEPRPKRSR